MKQIGLYIHIPFCKQKCLYCDFNSYEGEQRDTSTYIQGLTDEMAQYQNQHAFQYKTVFIGGGTPTFIHCDHIGRLMEKIRPYIAEEAEISMECNPGTLSRESLKYYKSLGINRLSIGLQAWQDGLLKKIGRIHTVEAFLKSFHLAREAGFGNINVDLMFALPGQTLDMWEETLRSVCALSVEHLSCYSLKLEEGTRLNDMYEKGQIQIPDEETDRQMYHRTVEILEAHGFKQYEISNFAKPGFECHHNLIYWRNQEYIGIGAGSHSKLGGTRFWNHRDIGAYLEDIKAGRLPIEGQEVINKEEDMWETIFLALRLNEGLDISRFDEKYGVCFKNKYDQSLQKLIKDGLLEIKGQQAYLTQRGRDLSNLVFVEFL